MGKRKNPELAKTAQTFNAPIPTGQSFAKELENLRKINTILKVRLEARDREVLELCAKIEELVASMA